MNVSLTLTSVDEDQDGWSGVASSPVTICRRSAADRRWRPVSDSASEPAAASRVICTIPTRTPT